MSQEAKSLDLMSQEAKSLDLICHRKLRVKSESVLLYSAIHFQKLLYSALFQYNTVPGCHCLKKLVHSLLNCLTQRCEVFFEPGLSVSVWGKWVCVWVSEYVCEWVKLCVCVCVCVRACVWACRWLSEWVCTCVAMHLYVNMQRMELKRVHAYICIFVNAIMLQSKVHMTLDGYESVYLIRQ